MNFSILPLECQIEIVKHHPLYRTLCKKYNNNYHDIFNNYYGKQKISLKELNYYINHDKPLDFIVFYADQWKHIKMTYYDHRVTYDIHTYTLMTSPQIFQSFYTNTIYINKYYSFDIQLELNNFIGLSPAITRGILKNRLNCTYFHYTDDFLEHNKELYCHGHLYDNDLNTLLSKLKCSIYANINTYNTIDIFSYNISFHNKHIHSSYKDKYDALMATL
jgi:hypothetical protein